MDYTTQSWIFKTRKALRYVSLYGIGRTWAKIRGQYHMKKHYANRPQPVSDPESGGHVGFLGCGNFAYSTIAYYLRRKYGCRVLRGCMDIDIHRAASLCQAYSMKYFTDDAERILSDPEIDLIYIASNHASHAEYAIRALRGGKAVHIEKPHCVNQDQLYRLCQVLSETGGRAALGFNRPGSSIGVQIRKHLDSQSGAAIFNWFVAGHKIDSDHWYLQKEEGGRVLGNLCHWTDFIYHLVPARDRFPIRITPTRSEQPDNDIAVTYRFGDGTIAAITFSSKEHLFEGIRERFAAQKGNALIFMDDFKNLSIEVGDRKLTQSNWFRDHGHEWRILNSYRMGRGEIAGDQIPYIWETGFLFLETKKALEQRESREIEGFRHAFATTKTAKNY